MGLEGVSVPILNNIISDLKTITELQDDGDRKRVQVWKMPMATKEGEFEAVVVGPIITPREDGVTVSSTWNELLFAIDMFYISATYEESITKALPIAEKIYDLFHLQTLGGLVRITRCSIAPGENEVSNRALHAVPIRIEVKCELVVSQL